MTRTRVATVYSPGDIPAAAVKGGKMRSTIFIVTGLLICSGVSIADVVVDLHDQPLVGVILENRSDDPRGEGLLAAPGEANQPATGYWFIPRYQADKLTPGDSTYFSVRNESLIPTTVVAEFFDVRAVLETSETYELDPREVHPVAVKFVPNLTIGVDGYARGFVRITAPVPVTVDFFQLETRNAFAVGGVGYVDEDFCTRWNARFLRFDTAGGTTLSMMINGPQGRRPGDPVTVFGDVYSESGVFLSSFTIRTDEWSIEVPVHDFVPPGEDFGVVELAINSIFLPAGIVEVRHQALGQFSVGHWAMCVD